MSLMSWMANKVANKVMDEADKELVFLRDVLADSSASREKFFETTTWVRDSVPEIADLWRGQDGQWAEHATRVIERLNDRHRFGLAQRLMEIAAKHARTDWQASSAIKVLSTWMKLVEIRDDPSGAAQGANRAANLIKAYEAELNRAIALMQ